MKAVIQRVTRAAVTVDGAVKGSIGVGFMVALGVLKGDGEAQAETLARKLCALRVFQDEQGKMNRDIKQAGGALLIISNFTLGTNCRRGNRPSFDKAEAPDGALALYERFCALCACEGLSVERGVFGAHMHIDMECDGPVTIILDTNELEAAR